MSPHGAERHTHQTSAQSTPCISDLTSFRLAAHDIAPLAKALIAACASSRPSTRSPTATDGRGPTLIHSMLRHDDLTGTVTVARDQRAC